MNIVAAQRQYRWPQANIVFADRQKYRSPIHLTPKQQSGHWEPPPNARKSSFYVHASGMNIVAAQRQYRWPQANIVFAAGKNIVPNTPHTQKTKQALGNNLPMPAF